MAHLCICGCSAFGQYRYRDKEYIVCKKCWREKSLGGNSAEAPEDQLHPVFRYSPVVPSTKTFKPEGERLSGNLELSPGDHIMWRRSYVIWHHAIVLGTRDQESGPPAREDGIEIMHWALKDCSIKIHQANVRVFGICSKTHKSTAESAEQELVLARAKALEGLTGYRLFHRNCENFARFCKTGVNFNHQYPWLMIKLNETATANLLGAVKLLVRHFPLRSIIERAKEYHFVMDLTSELVGISVVAFAEMVSLLTDLGLIYLINQHGSSGVKLEKEAQKELVIIRMCEFLFGTVGIIGGNILLEWSSGVTGEAYCPGLGSAIGLVMGVSILGVIGGFFFGALGKVIGNVVGICIGVKCKWCDCCCCCCCCGDTLAPETPEASESAVESQASGSIQDLSGTQGIYCTGLAEASGSTEAPGTAQDLSGTQNNYYIGSVEASEFGQEYHVPLFTESTETSQSQQNRERDSEKAFDYVYKPSSWRAQLGASMVMWGILLLYAYTAEYIHAYQPYRGVKPSTCHTIRSTNMSDILGNPCFAIEVRVNHNLSSGENTIISYEDEITLQLGKCSYDPWCKGKADMKDYHEMYGGAQHKFTCYQGQNQTAVIREKICTSGIVHMFVWPTISLLSGFILILWTFVRRRRLYGASENPFTTILILLGVWSYFDFFICLYQIKKSSKRNQSF